MLIFERVDGLFLQLKKCCLQNGEKCVCPLKFTTRASIGDLIEAQKLQKTEGEFTVLNKVAKEFECNGAETAYFKPF